MSNGKLETKVNLIIKIDEALFILKWGGQLTHTGIDQSIELG